MKTQKRQICSALLIALMLMGGLGMMLVTVPDDVQAATWYSSSWGYRKAITIANPDTTDYLNTTATVVISPTDAFWAHCLASGSDVRFIASDHSTVLNFWREYWNYTTKQATYSVQLTNMTGAATTTFYLYYGNAAAVINMSNGWNTFEFYDDFTYITERNWTTEGIIGNGPGGVFQKNDNEILEPGDGHPWGGNQNSMRGITVAHNNTEGTAVAYGSYVNGSYTVILGANSTNGMSEWTHFDNIMVNHSADDSYPDFIKAAEPHFLTNMSDSDQRDTPYDYDSDTQMCLYYSGLNTTNWSVNLASSAVLDATWTKYASNPVLWNGSIGDMDSAGCRSPVVWKENGFYKMLYAGCQDAAEDNWTVGYAFSTDMETWTKNYSWSVFNYSEWGWDNCSILPQDIFTDGIWYYMLYVGQDWTGAWRAGVAYTTNKNMVGWARWSGILGLGETGNFDADSVMNTAWNFLDDVEGAFADDTFVVYEVGDDAINDRMMGYATSYNATMPTGGAALGLQEDCNRNAGYHLTQSGRMKCWWNGTMLSHETSFANYTVSVDYWTAAAGGNLTVFLDSTANKYYGYDEDFYGARIGDTAGDANMTEYANGVGAEHAGYAYNMWANGTQQSVMVSQYGSYIWIGTDNFFATPADLVHTDASLTTGEVGIRQDSQAPIYYDYLRATGGSNGTYLCTVSATETPYTPPDSGAGGGGTEPIDDDDEIPIQPPVEEDDGGCCGITGAIIAIVMGMAAVATVKGGGFNWLGKGGGR